MKSRRLMPDFGRPVLVDPSGRPVATYGAWKSARRDRRQTAGWGLGVAGSADEDSLWDLPTLRNRSRQVVRDMPLAAGAINTSTKSVVGTGLSVRSEINRDIIGCSEDEAEAFQKKAEAIFNLWAGTKASDLTMTQNFWEQQDLAFRMVLESGDGLALTCYREHPSTPFGLCIQLVEGDRISNPDNQQDSTNLVAGVILDNTGAASGWWVQDQHPGASLFSGKKSWTQRKAFSASGRRIAHQLFMRRRPDQHRGIPYLATVIESLKELGEYTDGELRAAVISGLYTGFVTRKTEVDDDTDEPTAVDAGDGSGDREIELGYGTIRFLDDDEDIKFSTPGRPNTAFDPFVLAVLRQIGTALEIPYEILIQHFTASYSAARAALLELAKYVRRSRAWLADNFCQICYEALLEEAVARKMINAPGWDDPLKRLAYCGAVWTGDSMGQIDMGKEVSAWKEAVDAGFAPSGDASVALFGTDGDRVAERRAYEAKRNAQLKLPAPGATSNANAPQQPAKASGQPAQDTEEDAQDSPDLEEA